MQFTDIPFKPRNDSRGGVYARIDFANGYTASIIMNQYSYGGPDGLYEIAVLRGDDVVYDTPVTDDVIGGVEPENVTKILKQIEEL